MLYSVCIEGEGIISYDILNLAVNKAKAFKLKYPNKEISVVWSSWYEGKKGNPSEFHNRIIIE